MFCNDGTKCTCVYTLGTNSTEILQKIVREWKSNPWQSHNFCKGIETTLTMASRNSSKMPPQQNQERTRKQDEAFDEITASNRMTLPKKLKKNSIQQGLQKENVRFNANNNSNAHCNNNKREINIITNKKQGRDVVVVQRGGNNGSVANHSAATSSMTSYDDAATTQRRGVQVKPVRLRYSLEGEEDVEGGDEDEDDGEEAEDGDDNHDRQEFHEARRHHISSSSQPPSEQSITRYVNLARRGLLLLCYNC